MTTWRIRGGNPLHGSVRIQGSKNAVLPILAASLLGGGTTQLSNCPNLLDVDASLEILRYLGCHVMQNGREIMVNSDQMSENHIPHALMLKMRSSVMFLGAILARCGEVRLSTPGGCELGSRPIDLHLKVLRELGASVEECGGEVLVKAQKLRGTHINLDFPSVGATENLMLAACAAEGTTVLTNAAREPEIAALQDFLNEKGGKISGAGSAEIRIEGFSPRGHTAFFIPADRIAAATYLCAAASAGGEIMVEEIPPVQLEPVVNALQSMGCAVVQYERGIYLRRTGKMHAGRPILTKPYPGFPTDAQALLMAACLKAEGTSVFVENIFENRFRHVEQFHRLGGDIRVVGRVAMVTGVNSLKAAPLIACDLRGGASMVIAALTAEGETVLSDDGHILRGYDALEKCLRGVNADIARLTDLGV